MDDRESKSPLFLLYVGLKYDYGIPERGFSYEHMNFLDTLKRMKGLHVEFFPFDDVMREVGREEMNDRLLEMVKGQVPDICFFVLFTDEIKRSTIQEISASGRTTTLNWFGDDHWRFQVFSRHYAQCFHWVITTDSAAVEKYKGIGCRNVMLTQWGFNHHLYHRYNIPLEYDVTFIGQVHSRRRKAINRVQAAGIDVKCWGRGWEAGRLGQEEMIRMYSRSKINLNFTESSVVFSWKPLAKIFLNRRADNSIVTNTPTTMWDHVWMMLGDRRPQIKGRNFEIPGSGGFLLTSDAGHLEEYFVPGKEIAVFSDNDDLIDKVRYYLLHDDERESIRRAGYERALRDHTNEQRLSEILETMGFKNVGI